MEPRHLPVSTDRCVLSADDVGAAIDGDTIGVVATLGTTHTGEYDPIEDIHDAVAAYNRRGT